MLAAGVALALGGAPHAAAQDAKTSAGASVIVARATSACFSAAVHGSGFLMPRSEALVTLDAEGFRVVEVLAQEGDTVTAGQTLVRLSRRTPNGEQAAVLRAPAAGLIVKSSAVVGAVASPRAEPLFNIAVDKEIEAEVEVPSIHVPKLKAGQTARVTGADGREWSGRVRLVRADIDRNTQLGRVRVSVERDPSLRAGLFVSVTIDAIRSCGVAVPRAAVLYRTDGTSVQVVRDSDHVIETRRVRVGLFSPGMAEIESGVRESEMIVANAGTSLRDGDKVKPIFANQREAGSRP
jgi:HlyD family secretion protein